MLTNNQKLVDSQRNYKNEKKKMIKKKLKNILNFN